MSPALYFSLIILGIAAVAFAVGLCVLYLKVEIPDRWVLVGGGFFCAGVCMIIPALALANSPSSFTISTGQSVPVTVKRLTYLTAQFGGTEAVRVDTDHGPIVVSVAPAHPVPDQGRLYLVVRHHAWRTLTRRFLCAKPNREAFCWAERWQPL